MSSPEKISLAKLQQLIDTSKSKGIEPVSPEQLRQTISEVLPELKILLERMEGFTSDGVIPERWEHFESGRRLLRVSLRRLMKSISV